MKLSVDKKNVTEGDVVEVKWDCPKAESLKITINNGFKAATAEVENKGSKKYKLNRSNGQTVISIEGVENGKTVKKEILIKVKAPKVKKENSKKYDQYQRLDRKPIKEKIDALKSKFKYFWQSLPPQKKQAYILLSIIFGIMIISTFYPKIILFGMSILAIYLLWTLMKR